MSTFCARQNASSSSSATSLASGQRSSSSCDRSVTAARRRRRRRRGAVAGNGVRPAGSRVKVLPSPAPAARRGSRRRAGAAISRLMDRPRPVPPYLRLVVPSACWNASKMTRSFSAAMPMPVSMTEKAITSSPCRGSSGELVGRRAGSTRSSTRPVLGELDRVGEQVAQDLLQPVLVGVAALRARRRRDRRRSKPRPFSRGERPEGRLDVVDELGQRDLARGARPSCPASTLDRSRMSLISWSRSVPELWMVWRTRTCLVGEVAVGVVGEQLGQDQQAVQRRAQLVAHVGQELRLVLRDCELLAQSSSSAGLLDLEFFVSMPVLLAAARLLQLGVGAASCWRSCELQLGAAAATRPAAPRCGSWR